MKSYVKTLNDNRTIYGTIARIALPIAFQNTITASLNFIGSLMVGRVGETELTAVGLSTQLFFVQYMVLYGFISGSATFMSQYWGVRDLKSIKKVIGIDIIAGLLLTTIIFSVPAMFFPEYVLRIFTDNAEVISLGAGYMRVCSVGILFLCLSFPFSTALRTTEQTNVPMMISIVAFCVNIGLNYVLIFGKFGAPALGVVGAAIGTTSARICELVLYAIVIFARKNMLAGRLREYFAWNMKMAKRVIANSVPTTINESMWSMGMASYNAAYGRMGVSAFAAVQAGVTINDLFTMAIFSMGDASLILVGQELGRKRMAYAYELAKKILKVGICVGFLSGLLLIFTSQWLAGFFEFTEETRYLTQKILIVYGVVMAIKLSNGMQITGILRCGGDTMFAMKTELILVWCMAVPLVFMGALYLQLPVYMVVLMAQSEEVVKFFVLNRRFVSKKWMNNLIGKKAENVANK